MGRCLRLYVLRYGGNRGCWHRFEVPFLPLLFHTLSSKNGYVCHSQNGTIGNLGVVMWRNRVRRRVYRLLCGKCHKCIAHLFERAVGVCTPCRKTIVPCKRLSRLFLGRIYVEKAVYYRVLCTNSNNHEWCTGECVIGLSLSRCYIYTKKHPFY